MSALLEALGVERGSLVIVAAMAVWAVVVACAIFSILSQPFSRKQQILWIIAVVALPLLGMMAYLPFSVRKDNHPLLFQVKG
ncbi:MAG: PLDc N-terminal domain-containing protein [Limisphaerales bacterium]